MLARSRVSGPNVLFLFTFVVMAGPARPSTSQPPQEVDTCTRPGPSDSGPLSRNESAPQSTYFHIVTRGLVPRVHVFLMPTETRGWPGQARPRRRRRGSSGAFSTYIAEPDIRQGMTLKKSKPRRLTPPASSAAHR